MRGKVKFAKFPAGVYYCMIEDIKAGLNSKQEDIIIVSYRVQAGDKKDDVFKERLNSVSTKFLQAIGEPYSYNAEWDTERWRNKLVWVEVKYSEDEAQWPRYGHHANDPRLPEPVASAAEKSEDEIPF